MLQSDMHRILPVKCDWPLYGTARSRAIETAALAAAGRPAGELMARAGAATARLARALAPHAERVWVACGPGNNGGDGFVAARCLHEAGHAVTVSFWGDPARLPDDARAAWAAACAAGVPIAAGPGAQPPALGAADLAIDALLGLGQSRPLDGALASAAQALNALPCPVLAVDLPTGLGADSGQPTGPVAVRARHTLSLLTLKPGLFTGSGRDWAGTVWFDDLGVSATGEPPDAWLAGPSRPQPRQHVQHKGSFGDLLVVGGAPGMTGALWLAARAAHAAGAGRVWTVPLDPAAPRLDPTRPELMSHAVPAAVPASAWSSSTAVCGCGGGTAIAQALPTLLDAVPRLVLDADALNALATNPSLFAALATRADRGQLSVLTPHPLEAARLLGWSTAQVQGDRLGAAQALATRHRAVVVLKGSGTVIAGPGQCPRINGSGNAALASPGTGDVLAGWLGGRWSATAGGGSAAPSTHDGQAAHPAFAQAHAVACEAVWAHGAAADASGRPVLRAADLIEGLARRDA